MDFMSHRLVIFVESKNRINESRTACIGGEAQNSN